MYSLAQYSQVCGLVLPGWLGSKFVYGGSSKQGCDCFGLIAGIYTELHLKPQHTDIMSLRTKYQPNSLRLASQLLPKFLNTYYVKVIKTVTGDLAFFRFASGLFHVAMFWEDSIVHARLDVGCVVRQEMDSQLQVSFLGYFRLKEFSALF